MGLPSNEETERKKSSLAPLTRARGAAWWSTWKCQQQEQQKTYELLPKRVFSQKRCADGRDAAGAGQLGTAVPARVRPAGRKNTATGHPKQGNKDIAVSPRREFRDGEIRKLLRQKITVQSCPAQHGQPQNLLVTPSPEEPRTR